MRAIFIFICLLLMYTSVKAGVLINEPRLKYNLNEERKQINKNDTIKYKLNWFLPDNLNIQFAGEIGFLSVGIGYKISKVFTPMLYYGYLGKYFGGNKNSIHTISVKNKFNIMRKPILGIFIPTAGMSINWGHTNNTFKKLPSYYPDKYYFQNKIHLAPFVGGELNFNLKENALIETLGVYAEFTTIDAYLLECIRTEYVTLGMITSLALGITLHF